MVSISSLPTFTQSDEVPEVWTCNHLLAAPEAGPYYSQLYIYAARSVTCHVLGFQVAIPKRKQNKGGKYKWEHLLFTLDRTKSSVILNPTLYETMNS